MMLNHNGAQCLLCLWFGLVMARPKNSMEVHAEPAGEGLERGQRFRRSKELVWSALSSRRGSTTDIDAASKI
jgi:hypothetical protein